MMNNMEEKFVRLNIALRMPEDVAKAAINLSEEIAKNEDAFFILDGSEYFPHVTIYQPEFPEKNVEAIIEAVGEIIKKFSKLKLTYIQNIAAQGWIGVYFENSAEVKRVHEEIVTKINPFREEHLREKYKNADHCQMISEEQRNNILNYGYSTLMGLYAPHLTITRLKNYDFAEKIADQINWQINEFEIDTVGIFIGGEHGTCTKLLKEFKLN